MIALSKPLRDYLVGELRNAATLMGQNAPNPVQSLFYYSACYGATQRVLNIEFSEKVMLLHFILHHSFLEVSGRITQLRAGQELGVELPEGFFSILARLVAELGDKLAARQEISGVLEKLVTATYATTGNGYYLYTVGRLKISK